MKKYSIKNYLKLADIFTIGNIVFGFLAILFFIKGDFYIGSGCLVFAAVLDFIDGPIARRTHGATDYGKMLDLADLVSFGAAPAVFISILVPELIGYIASIILLVSSLLRMARYAVVNTKIKIGMPITVNGLLFPALFLVNEAFAIGYFIFPLAAIVSSILMVKTFSLYQRK
jgi:CDP-diacylglycerol---serine O-phosphatidyltransferase